MSSDNGLIINLKTFKVTYYMGDGEIDTYKCNSLEEACQKAKKLNDEVGGTEYGVQFTGHLPKIKLVDNPLISEKYKKP